MAASDTASTDTASTDPATPRAAEPLAPASGDSASPWADGREPVVAILGGGIAGLAAAFHLHERTPRLKFVLFEAAGRVGGVIRTERRGEFQIERGPDMFTTKQPWCTDLCHRLGLADQLIGVNAEGRTAYVVRRGRLEPVPEGFALMTPVRTLPVLRSRIFSWPGKLRLAMERWVRPLNQDVDESLEQFAVRRCGREAFERLIQPLVGGIYTADPACLSMKAALPEFLAMEKKYGSLTRGAQQAAQARGKRPEGGARYGLFLAPRQGMEQIVDALIRRLPAEAIRLNTPVTELRPADGGWQVAMAAGSERFDGVIVATPSPAAAKLVQPWHGELGERLAAIPHAGVAVVVCGIDRSAVRRLPPTFGIVVPRLERRNALAISLSSNKFAGRAPDDKLLVRVFVGGACQPELLERSDEELVGLVRRELGELIGLQDGFEFSEVVRWSRAMPQYHVGHLERVAAIEELIAKLPHIELAGNAYHGVGVPFALHSGEQAADRLLASLARR